MGGSSHAAISVGAVVIAGGLYAFIRKGSMPSLYGSVALGGGLLLGGYLIQSGKNYEGHALAALSSIALTGVGAQRYFATAKYMPALPIVIIGSLSSIYQLKKFSDWS